MATSAAQRALPNPAPASEPGIRILRNNEGLTRGTTISMVGTLEWAAPVFQAIVLFVSGIYDYYLSFGRVIVIGLAAAHIFLIPLYYRGFGPFALGGRWIAISLVECLCLNALLALLSRPRTYGDYHMCVPGCNYSATVWLFLAFYPWLPLGLARLRALIEALLLAAYYLFYLGLTWLSNGSLSWLNVETTSVSLVWLLLGYLMGKAIGRMCLAAAQKQLEVQQQNFSEFFDFLHSHVKSSIAAVRLDLLDPLRAREKLDELEKTISGYRVELLLAQEQVPLAALFSERIRTFTGVLEMMKTPRLGGLTVGRPIGVLIGRALGDLLNNAAKYGATAVDISFDSADGLVRLEIADNGPGFAPEILDDPSRSLYRLREAARDLGGELTMQEQDPQSGAVLTLVAPLHAPEAVR